MRRRLSKPWRVVQWMGVAACVVMIPCWLLSEFKVVLYQGQRLTMSLSKGSIIAFETFAVAKFVVPSSGFYGLHVHPTDGITPRIWWPGWGLLPHGYVMALPFWFSLLVVSLPTCLLFRIDRYPKGHCQHCGYDLTGNESGTCPECGRTT